MMKEIWRPVRGYEEFAEISNYGQIHRFEREYYSGGNYQIKHIQEETWTYGYENNGYLKASIGGISKGVHVWVYLTFVGEIPEGLEVNHIDEDKHNNCVWNLNLMTRKENNNWGTHNERVAAALRGRKLSDEVKEKISAAHKGRKRPVEVGAKISAAKRGMKLSEEHKAKISAALSKAVQALDKVTGEVVMEFPSTREAERHGFDHTSIGRCCNGKLKTYKGYIWRHIL